MQRLIDANALKKLIAKHVYLVQDAFNSRDYGMFWTGGIEKAIDEIPTVDAVEVVRCDDCIYRDGNTPGQPNILCWQMHSDDYCSYGTKREVGTYCKNIVSVVRCEDCKKYIPCQKLPIGTSKWCDLFDRATCEMNYCAWGERKEDAETD